MIEIVNTPAVIIDETTSPAEISYLLATESPVIFQFQRKEGTPIAITDSSGNCNIEYEDGFEYAEGSLIALYDSVNDVMIQGAVVTVTSATVIITNIPFVARYDTDITYIINYTARPFYYLECRLKVNGAYQSNTMRFSPNTKGLVKADISQFLQSEVNGTKLGNYLNDSTAETNQSGEFVLEYRERYTGDTNEWVVETNTWYYILAVRSKEQGSNLYDYVGTETNEGKWMNEFVKPVWAVGTPFDLQFWWNPIFDALSAVVRQYDASNDLLATSTIVLNNESKGKLCSVKISLDTIEEYTDYLTVEVIEP